MLTIAVPGPCQFCASIGAPCRLDPSRRRQRPYYRVSEEEFRYMTQLLEHFIPDTDLNLHTLKALASKLGSSDGQAPAPAQGIAALSPASSNSLSPAKTEAQDAHTEAGEIDELHQQLGWLRVDSNGIYSEPPSLIELDGLPLTGPRTCRRELNLHLPRRGPLPQLSPACPIPEARGPRAPVRRLPSPTVLARIRRPPQAAAADQPAPPRPLRRLRGPLLPGHPVGILVLLCRAAARRA